MWPTKRSRPRFGGILITVVAGLVFLGVAFPSSSVSAGRLARPRRRTIFKPPVVAAAAQRATAETVGKTFIAKATIYANNLNGHKAANGERFHQSDHTAASNKLPLGTEVEVTSLRTSKSTNVTLIDHGPALGSNKIDLSRKAAREIGLTGKQGTVPVKIKVTRTLDRLETPPTRSQSGVGVSHPPS
jgi:rare lipoprotein A